MLFEKHLLILGDEWGAHERSRVVQMDKGVHKLRFAFGPQLENMASSVTKTLKSDNADAIVSLQWRVRARIDIPEENPMILEVPLEVGGYQYDQLLAYAPEANVASIFQRSTTITYSITPGSVVIRASSDKEAYYPGENILLHLNIASTLRHRIVAINMDVRNFAKVELPGIPMLNCETIGVGTDDSVVIEPGGSLERSWPVEIPRNAWASVLLEKASVGVYVDVSLVVEGLLAGDSTLRLPFIVLLQKPSQRLEYKAPADPAPNPKSIPWMLDEETNVCCVCANKFSMIARRHHCRNCGMVVCSKCSPKIINVDSYGQKPQRVCTNCAPRRK
jgi:hypothetical protein